MNIKIWWNVILYKEDGTATAFGFSSVEDIIINAPEPIAKFKNQSIKYRHFKQWLVENKAKVNKCAEQII